jgi:outer membrane protein
MRRAFAFVALAGLFSAPFAALADPPAAPAPPPGPPPPPPPPAAQTDESGPVKVERISLSTAVQRALARNPSVAAAIEEVRRSQAIVREVRAASFPTVSGNLAYTRLSAPSISGGVVLVPESALTGSATLTVPLVAPKSWAQWSQSKDSVEALTWTEADTRRQIAVAVARAYLTVIAEHRLVELSRQARDTAKAHFDFAETRFKGGLGNRIDAVRAEQEMMTDEAELQATLAAVARAQEALGVLIASNVALDVTGEPQLAPPPLLPVALDELPGRRPDVQAFEARKRATEHVVRDNWTDYSPYLAGSFQGLFETAGNPTPVATQGGWQAQLILTIPFYDGGLRYGQQQERDVNVAEAKVNLDAALRQARSDVRVAFESLRRADESLIAAKRAASLADEALDLANIAYRGGATTNLEVIDAERAARDAETAAAVAEDNARQARLDLLSASGRFP